MSPNICAHTVNACMISNIMLVYKSSLGYPDPNAEEIGSGRCGSAYFTQNAVTSD